MKSQFHTHCPFSQIPPYYRHIHMSFLLINKPEGWTSFDAVAFVRNKVRSGVIPTEETLPGIDKQWLKTKKLRVGHAGTLDPFATGLLIIGVGRESTRRLDEFKKMPKTYIAEIKLGQTSNTYDKTGTISDFKSENKKITRKEILSIVKTFIGRQLQTPPMFSAKKINGQRLYDLARKGIEIDRKPNEIDINKIKVIKYAWPILKIEVQCSAGTYIRSLAHDIGHKLGTGAYCQELVRTKIGKFLLKKAINLDTLK
jgi:tRNA pseudouridine55 synthase